MSKNVYELATYAKVHDQLSELIRTGATLLLHQAVEAELQELMAQHADRLLED